MTGGFSIRDAIKRRIINDMVRHVQPAGKWKVMVVDPISMRILNHSVKMFDILDENVTLVELITKKRQPYPSLDAIYFLSPTPEAIAYFINDFCPGGGRKPLYAAAHLFFLSALPDALMQEITSSGAAPFIRNLQELFVDVIPLEQRVFSLEDPNAFFKLYSPEAGGLVAQNAELEIEAKKLVSLCATLGDLPYIRYHKPRDPDNTRAAKLAHLVAAELEALSKLGTGFPSVDPQHRSTLVIADRTLDVYAPLLHEFTYQAMAHDLLPIQQGKYLFAGTSSDQQQQNDETAEKKEVLLDDNDQLWVQLRHMFIPDVLTTITAQFAKFLNENKAASNYGKEGAASLKDMKDVLAAMPQFQELKQKYTIHINLSQECMNAFNRRKLNQVGEIEQDLSTGEKADGSKIKNVVNDMVPLLNDSSIIPYDKVRLLMMYVISKEGVQDDDRRKLLDHANISVELAEAITNLARLGVALQSKPKKRDKKDDKKKKKKGGDDDEGSYELMRYTPALKLVMEDQVAGALDAESFPYLGPQPAPDTGRATGGTSLRSTKPSWQKKGQQQAAAAAAAAGGDSASAESGAKVIVYMLGGMTYSEIRAAYEVATAQSTAANGPRDVLIGSSHIVTPAQFVDAVKCLRNPAAAGAIAPPAFGYGPGPSKLPDLPAGKKAATAAEGGDADGKKKKKKKKRFLGLF
ncbi:vacuolar sorting protein VPS33/slp1 [Allomyces arbusculus]|nr:vacuolar sorting protein VPS33/slp1 [Allomyces arbusculus]